MTQQNYFVFTGGPGAGKTTVLDCLTQKGYIIIPEVARNIIRDQVAQSGEALPWKNKVHYQQLMAEQTIDAFNTAPRNGSVCLFDRGLPDVIAYGRLISNPLDDALHQAALNLRYHHRVFIFPPWKEIYTTDTERKQDFEEAVTTFHIIYNTYEQYGYELIQVPFAPPEERATFIMNAMRSV